MYCRFCGKEIPEGGRFCINCGKEVDVTDTAQAGVSQTENPAPGARQPWENEYQQPYPRVNPDVLINPAKNYHLAWFKFIIYFQLFANAAVMVYNAVTCLFGLAYGDDAAVVYAVCPGLKVVDVIYGIICLCAAVTAILIRQRLGHYKKNAPVFYMSFVGAVMALGLLYNFAVLAVLNTVSSSVMQAGAANMAETVLGTVIGAAVYFPLNYIYFKKRKELFVN